MVGSGIVALSLLTPVLSTGQTVLTDQPVSDSKLLATLLQEVQTQQKTIADNQAKMDAKIAAIAENLRQARIYVTRGGGKTR